MASRVVLVDDDPFNLKIARNILVKNNIDTVALHGGYELLDYLKEDTPDLILLDIMMPGLNGFETLTKIREFEKERDMEEIPVIFLTSDDDNKSETLGFEMGVSDYIRKPFEPAVLIRRISNVLNRQEILHRFHEEATIDNLTGLLNKSATNNKLEMLCRRKPGGLYQHPSGGRPDRQQAGGQPAGVGSQRRGQNLGLLFLSFEGISEQRRHHRPSRRR